MVLKAADKSSKVRAVTPPWAILISLCTFSSADSVESNDVSCMLIVMD